MMPDLVLHPRTVELLQRLTDHPAQALLIVAPEGAGKQAVAEHLAAAILKTSDDKLASHAYYKLVGVPKDKTSVPIEAVRELQHYAKLKAPGNGARVAVIDQAHTMQHEAQNAALKLLEEPPENMVLMLLTANEQALLPTIRSRTQAVAVHLPSKSLVSRHFIEQGHDESEVAQAVRYSGGLPGLTHALLTNSKHPLINVVDQARDLLKATQLERLGAVDTVGKSRDDAIRLCAMLQRMAVATLDVAAEKGSNAALKQWHRILAAANEAERALRQNAQPKLVLTHLMLSL